MKNRILHVALFLLVMLATAAGLRHLDPLPFWSWARQRIGYAAEHLGDYDLICIGSSRIHRSFAAEEFDRRCAELGTEVHSFNLGIAGRRPHDFARVVDWLVEHRTDRLKYVLIESDTFRMVEDGDDWMSTENIEMHTLDRAWPRIRTALHGDLKFSAVAKTVYQTLAMTLVNYLRVGQAQRIATDRVHLWNRGRLNLNPNAGAEGGFEPLAPETAQEYRRKQHEQWRAQESNGERLLVSKRRNVANKVSEPGLDLAALRELVAKLRSVGVEPVFVIPPRYSYFKGRSSIYQLGPDVRVLAMDDPDEHADLYEYRLWFDSSHLMREGSVLFTRRLAEQFVK